MLETLLFALFILPALLLNLLLHETSHYVAARLAGATITSFKPWPHEHNGYPYFGRVSWQSQQPVSRWVYASPWVTHWGLMVAGFFLGYAWAPLFALFIAGGIDCVWWWRGYFIESDRWDGWKWRTRE